MLKKIIAIPLLLALLAGGLSGCYFSAGIGRHGAGASGSVG